MRAARIYETGGPAVVQLEELERPRPSDNQVLVQVAACGVCGHDQADRMGLTKIPLPAVLGHELAGTVVELGARARGFEPGDRVAAKQFTTCGRCAMCLSGRELECPSRSFNYGGYAEFVAVEDSALLRVPDGLDLVGATVAACAVGTCHQALVKIAQVRPGEHVAVTGAGGGLGIHGVQVARALGAVSIALTSSPDKVEQLRGLGADHVVDTSDKDFWKALQEITGGRGIEVVLDNVGHPALFSGCFRALARGGRYVFTGQVSAEKVSFHPAFVFGKEAVITGSASTSMSTFVESLRLVAEGQVKPVVETHRLDDVVEVFEAVDDRRVVGRAVLVP
jgi:D-arabinose 1-dehydrogenase-like Zn-dependent alcohol dehydrogenase